MPNPDTRQRQRRLGLGVLDRHRRVSYYHDVRLLFDHLVAFGLKEGRQRDSVRGVIY